MGLRIGKKADSYIQSRYTKVKPQLRGTLEKSINLSEYG